MMLFIESSLDYYFGMFVKLTPQAQDINFFIQFSLL